MKRFSVWAAVWLMVMGSACGAAAEGPFGLGLILGNPTGLSAKYFLDREHAIDAALGFSSSHIHFHADYLWHRYNVFAIDAEPIDFYFGVGGRIIEDDHHDHNRNRRNDDTETWFGVRVPVGLRHQFRNPAIEVFLELALVMNVVPETDADLDLGIGGRFFF